MIEKKKRERRKQRSFSDLDPATKLEVNKLFSEAWEKLDKVDEEAREAYTAIVIKYIKALGNDVPKEKIPSTIVKYFYKDSKPDPDDVKIDERFVHECMLKMNEKGGGI